jgi:hypothetical protein
MMTIAPAPDDLPPRPKGPQKPKPPRTFEEVLKELRPDLEKLPASNTHWSTSEQPSRLACDKGPVG